jgi:branched-chain amino acid transport system ATP-binding protein
MTELAVDNLVVPIGVQTVLRGVGLRVAPGAIVCVLGSNGVGKTTLMRAIGGIYRNATGSIRFAGQNIINLPPHTIVARGISQAPEGRHIFASMTVAENLRVGAGARPWAEMADDIRRMVALFPVLGERMRQLAGSLSGGEQQMLCIARAMMARPQLLLLDEPSLGLAPIVVRMIFDLIARIREGGTSILLVEQNARAALRVSDYAYVMEGGRMVLDGPAAEIAAERRVMEAYLGAGPVTAGLNKGEMA